MRDKDVKENFTPTEKRILRGLSRKIARKRRCSSVYVRHMISGRRGAGSVLAQDILKDANALLELLSPEE